MPAAAAERLSSVVCGDQRRGSSCSSANCIDPIRSADDLCLGSAKVSKFVRVAAVVVFHCCLSAHWLPPAPYATKQKKQ